MHDFEIGLINEANWQVIDDLMIAQFQSHSGMAQLYEHCTTHIYRVWFQ